MTSKDKTVSHPDLKGSEQHLPLKDDPGGKGDPAHTGETETMDRDMAKTVKSSGEKTQIADALRALANDS